MLLCLFVFLQHNSRSIALTPLRRSQPLPRQLVECVKWRPHLGRQLLGEDSRGGGGGRMFFWQPHPRARIHNRWGSREARYFVGKGGGRRRNEIGLQGGEGKMRIIMWLSFFLT